MLHFEKFDYGKLNSAPTSTKYVGGDCPYIKYSELVITVDTETSKSKNKDDKTNHVCIWTMTIRDFDKEYETLWGRTPGELVKCLHYMRHNIHADKVLVYIHNLGYDYIFLRKFLFKTFGYPVRQLNVKPLEPVSVEFKCGYVIRDSLVIAQRKLEKWAEDLDVEHKKAVGKWDYSLYRNSKYEYSEDELEYAEFDTRALAECIVATAKGIGVKMKDMPYTCTGIVRNEVRKVGFKNNAREEFLKACPDFVTYKQLEACYSGGYTHGHRDLLDTLQFDVECRDFASSYPFVMMCGRVPVERFKPVKSCNISRILNNSDKYGFIFNFVARDIRLKDDRTAMPYIQYAHCKYGVNMEVDNGRVIKADLIEIPMTEQDLLTISEQYDYSLGIALNVKCSKKDYLPKWLRDYVWSLWYAKCTLKGGDPVLYALAKSKLNSVYGMCVEKWTKFNILEDYENNEYKIDKDTPEEDIFDHHINNKRSILQYQWGVWISAIARRNLFKLGKCIDMSDDGLTLPWIYSDTDSIYSNKWNEDKLAEYNKDAKQQLIDAGYGAVEYNGKEFWLGVAEFDGRYKEFKTLGCKRYACITEDGHVKITVAGVPKKSGARFLERAGRLCKCDPLDFFKTGLVFPGKITGKLGHSYLFRNDIIIDDDGNEIGDSIDLVPCDYKLSRGEVVDIDSKDFNFEEIMDFFESEEIGVKCYED